MTYIMTKQKQASPRFIVTLEQKQEDEIEKAVQETGLTKAAIVRLGAYWLAKNINNGKINQTLLETLKELDEINYERGKANEL